MASDKSLAAEIEAVTERERTRLIAWLAEHQVSTASGIDREMTADALMADFIAPLVAEIDRLKDRLEIKWAYDGSGNRVPFPARMKGYDGIACRDETIRNLEEQAARLRAEGEAKDRALKDLRADAAELGARLGNTSQYDDRRVLRDLCWEAGNFLARRVIRTALARAATAREG